MSTLKDRLNTAMLVRRKSAADLARAVGKSESAVSQWLSGETKSMRSDNLMATCIFLQCNPQWLASNKGASGLDDPINPAESLHASAAAVTSSMATLTVGPNLETHLKEVGRYLSKLGEKGKVHAKSALSVLVDDPEDFAGVAAAIMAQIDIANETTLTDRLPKSTISGG